MEDEDEKPLLTLTNKAHSIGPAAAGKVAKEATATPQHVSESPAPGSATDIAAQQQTADAAATQPKDGQEHTAAGPQKQAEEATNTSKVPTQADAAQREGPAVTAAAGEAPPMQPALPASGKAPGAAEEGKKLQRSTRGKASTAPARTQPKRGEAQRKPQQAGRAGGSKRDREESASSSSSDEDDSSSEDEDESESEELEEEEEEDGKGRRKGQGQPAKKRQKQAADRQPASRARGGRGGDGERGKLVRKASKQLPAVERKGRRQGEKEQQDQAGKARAGGAKAGRAAAPAKERRVVFGAQSSEESEEVRGSDKEGEEEQDQGPTSPPGHAGPKQAADTAARRTRGSAHEASAPTGKGDAGRKCQRTDDGDGAVDGQVQGRAGAHSAADVKISDADFKKLDMAGRLKALQNAIKPFVDLVRQLEDADQVISDLVEKWKKVPFEVKEASQVLSMFKDFQEPELQAKARFINLRAAWKKQREDKIAEEHKGNTKDKGKTGSQPQAQAKLQSHKHPAPDAGKSAVHPAAAQGAAVADGARSVVAKPSVTATGLPQSHTTSGAGTPKKPSGGRQEGRVTSPSKHLVNGAVGVMDVGGITAEPRASANGTAAASITSQGVVTICGFQSRQDPERDAAVCLLTRCLTPSSQCQAQPLEVALQLEQRVHERCATQQETDPGKRKDAPGKQYSDVMHTLWGLLSADEQQTEQHSQGDVKPPSTQRPVSLDIRDLLLSGSMPQDKLMDELFSLAGRMHQHS